MKITYKILLICLILFGQIAHSQNNIDTLIFNLKNAESFSTVENACEGLIKKGKKSIPKLIETLKDTLYINTATADLIYPGAEKFYGHGNLLFYNINFVSIRAGWVLEKLTYEDFGYRTHKKDIAEFYNEDSITIAKITQNRSKLANKVEMWWKKNRKKWTHLNALKKALKNNTFWEQYEAIEYLKKDENLKNFDEKKFNEEVKPLLKKLIKNDINEMGRSAEWILEKWKKIHN